MSNPETNQAAHVAFSSTVASALARSIRDTPLHPQQVAPDEAPTAPQTSATDFSAADDGKEAA